MEMVLHQRQVGAYRKARDGSQGVLEAFWGCLSDPRGRLFCSCSH